MKLKTLAVCVALLAVVAGAAYFLSRPEAAPPADPRVGRPLLDPAAAADVAKIVVSDQGKSVALVRQGDGSWVVASYFDLPADFSKISRLIGDLNEAKLDRFVTANPDRIARLEFKDAKIALFDAAGRETWSLVLGKAAATGSSRFVRFGQEPKAFATSLQAYLDPEAKNWADTQLLNLKPEEIKSVELPLEPRGSVTFTRAKPEAPWTSPDGPDGRKVKADAVTAVLGSVGALRFTETTALNDPAAGEAEKHRRTLALTTFGGQTFRIALGRRPEQKKLKPPVADAKSGPASLGKSADLAKDAPAGSDTAAKPGAAKPGAPEFETIAAGPVFAAVASSDAHAPVNALMKKRAFEIDDYTFTSLPKTVDDVFDPAPPKAAAPAKPEAGKSGAGKTEAAKSKDGTSKDGKGTATPSGDTKPAADAPKAAGAP
jgi:hypothetical protein